MCVRLNSFKSRERVGLDLADDMRQVLQYHTATQVRVPLPERDALVAPRPANVNEKDGIIVCAIGQFLVERKNIQEGGAGITLN